MERPQTNLKTGLTAEAVVARAAAGQRNSGGEVKTKSVGTIFRENLLTPFNILNLILALLVIGVGSWKNVLFMGVILSNVIIGTVQELRAKAIIDKLSLIAAPHANILRDGVFCKLPLNELVLDDLMRLSAGNQVGADCVVREGGCTVNESLLTGESDPVAKGVGDRMLSGSFLVAGHCMAQVVHVGLENYAAQITAGAKYLKKPQSQMMTAVNGIIRVVSILLGPVGVALFVKQVFFSGMAYEHAVVTTVAALVGMIPEGLVLLTSVVMAVSVIRLSQRRALVQELYAIEMLARVDTLCLDKTGTLTSGAMEVEGLTVLSGGEERVTAALAALLAATQDDNPTAVALSAYVGNSSHWTATATVPFQSARKWSGATFQQSGTWVLGALEFVLPGGGGEVREQSNRLAASGSRVLLLAQSMQPFGGDSALPQDLVPVALIRLSDQLRPGAAETLAYFHSQGVDLKVISGDNPRTVAALAQRVGLPGGENWVDATTLTDEAMVRAAAEQYTVFGRVTPQQKLLLVQGLKAAGHTVAMTGDGVNDVLALRESHCSVAMAAGSEAARNVSQIVLMDSDFSALPHIVAEGRRAINNLQRSASLFLTKTMFSTVVALCFLFIAAPYPFQPIQFTLISALCIGAPSFLLALEPNGERVSGSFLATVLGRAAPGAAAMAVGVLTLTLLGYAMALDSQQVSTLCVLTVGFSGLLNLYFVSKPLSLPRGILLALMAVGFYGGAWLLAGLLSLAPLTGVMLPLLAATMALSLITTLLARLVARTITKRQDTP